MNILILAAMDKEIDLLLNLLTLPSQTSVEGSQVWQGRLGNNNIWISKCGIGKVNSALRTLQFIRSLKPDMVLNSGVAGGAGVPVGSIIVAEKVAYHDVWCGPGTDYGQADGIPLFMKPSSKIISIASNLKFPTGLVCSGDKFISTPEEIAFIRSKFPEVKAVDMESASVAQTCFICGIDFAIIRVVSDTPGEGENINQYKNFWQNAPQSTFKVLSEFLDCLK